MTFNTIDLMFNGVGDAEKSKEINKELVDFINRNLEKIMRKGRVKFNFKIIDGDSIKSVKKMGIKELPAAINMRTSDIAVGLVDIKSLINEAVDGDMKAPKKVFTAEEMMDDYNQSIMLQGDGDDDAFEDNSEELMNQYNDAIQARAAIDNEATKGMMPAKKLDGGRNNKKRVSREVKPVSSYIPEKSKGSMDDDMERALMDKLGYDE